MVTNESLIKIIKNFEEGLNFYRDGDWEKAKKIFTKVLEINPNDNPSKLFVERCNLLISNPPENWDGVWTMTTK